MFHGAGTTALMVVALFSGSASATPVNADPAIPGCTQLILTPSMHSAPLSGIPASAPVSINVYANSGCSWDVVVPGAYSWIHVTPNHGTGAGNLHISVDPSSTGTRTGYVHVLAGNIHRIVTVNQGTAPPGTCTVATVPANGQTDTVDPGPCNHTIAVSTGTTCTWSATVTSEGTPWLTLVTATGQGPGTCTFHVTQNPGAAQLGSITIATANGSSIVHVNQTACTTTAPADGLVIEQSSVAAPSSTPVIFATTDCQTQSCAWSAVVASPPTPPHGWFQFTNSSGNGNGSVAWHLDENGGSARHVMIQVTSAGNTSEFRVEQDGPAPPPTCSIDAPVNDSTEQVDSTAHPNYHTTVTMSDSLCGWTAAITSQDPSGSWVTLGNHSSETGDFVGLDIRANDGADPSIRTVEITVTATEGVPAAISKFTVQQGVPGACTYETSPANGTTMYFDSSPQVGSIGVTAVAGCNWSAASTDSTWLTIVSGSPGSGDGVIQWKIPNANAAPTSVGHIATIVVKNQDSAAVSTLVFVQGCMVSFETTAGCTVAPFAVPTFDASQSTPQSELVTIATPGDLTVHGQCNWTAIPQAGWVTVGSTGDAETCAPLCPGNYPCKSFPVTVSTNSGPHRSALVTVGYEDPTTSVQAVELVATVSQDAASGLHDCDVNETSPTNGETVHAPAASGALSLSVVSLPSSTQPSGSVCQWTVSSDSAWLTVSPHSGTGIGVVECTFGTNDFQTNRLATVTVYFGSAATPGSIVHVVQDAAPQPQDCTGGGAPHFSPATATVTLDPNGERGSIGVLAGEVCVWSATVDSPWLQCSPPTDATGAGSISWNAQANTSGAARHGTITVTGGPSPLILTLSQASGAVGCAAQLMPFDAGTHLGWPGPSELNLMFSFGVSPRLQQRLTEQFGAAHWDEHVFVNLFSDLGASSRPAAGWPVMSLSGHPGCQFVTASDRTGNLIPANRFPTIRSNFLSASFPLSRLRYSVDGGHYLVTNATATADWFPGTLTWEGFFDWCTGSPLQECINSGQILLSIYRPLESQGGAVASCLATNQSPNCPSPVCGSVAGMDGELPAQSFAAWCADSYQHNQNCVDVAETWWNCDQLTPQTSVEFTWPADLVASQLSGDVTYINGVGLPVDWTNWNCNGIHGSSPGQPAQDGVLGYSFEPGTNPPTHHHALGTGFAQGWWAEDSFSAAPVKAFNADDWSKLTQYLTSASTPTGTKLATLTSFPSYPPGTPPACDVAGASGATWDYGGYGHPPHTDFCPAASQTNPCMPLEFASATTWNFTAHWVHVGDAHTQRWWEPLQSLEEIGQATIPGIAPAEYFYASFIAAEETGFVVCTGTVKTSPSDFPPIGSTFYVVMPYQQNFADASQIYTPNPKYVVLWDSPNNSSVTPCATFGGRITDTAFEESATSYWRRYWANGSDASAMASISGDLSNSIVWGVFANTTAVNATPRTINGQDWGSVYSYCPVGSSGQLVDLSMGAYYCLLANLNGTNGEIPKWIGGGLGGTIFSEYVSYWVANSYETGSQQPVAVGYYTSYQDRIKAGPLGQSAQNPTLNSGTDFGYIQLTVMDPWTPGSHAPPLGDIDGSGCTDAEDIALMLSVWGPVEANHPADLTDDGLVDSRDIPKILEGFGNGCPH